MITIKDFAREQGCGESIVYRHIRNHKEELGDRVQKVHGRTWLTDDGVNYIKNLMTQHMAVEEKAAPEVLSLQKQLVEKDVTIKAQDAVIEAYKLKFEQYEADKKLLAERKDKIDALEAQNGDLRADNEKLGQKVAKAEKTAQEANTELERERQRRITFKEYWKRRKNEV